MWDDESEGVMFDLHTLVEGSNLRHHLEIVFEQIGLEHRVEIFRNLLPLMEAALQIIRYLSDIRHVHVLVTLIVVFGELEINFLGEEEFQEEVHQFTILLLLEILVSEHRDTAADHQFPSAFLVLVNRTYRSVAGVGEWT